jgi:monofunctional biosynthetic peptidoglycan transglycosylase
MTRFFRRWGTGTRIAAALVLLPVAIVLLLRFVPPPTSAFMLEAEHHPVHYKWVPWQRIAPDAALAVVAAEDQKFPTHWGFDFEAMAAAFRHNERSHHVRGASTISQQTAKNLFLWGGRSYLRKGLEAGITVLLETFWPKRRILEVYLNIAQFGPGIYGVEAASEHYFGKPAARLSPLQAATLAAVLPDPDALHVDRPSAYVRARAADIETQMRQLGSHYLDSLR